MRKSIRIAKGVNLNLSKSGVGVSVGRKGARYSVHSSGRRTASVGLPGTGIGYTSSRGGGRSRSSGGARPTASRAPTAAPPPRPVTPGLLAPKGEKLLYAAMTKQPMDLEVLQRVADGHPDWRMPALTLGGLTLVGRDDVAKALLAEVFAAGYDLQGDGRMTKYLHESSLVEVAVAEGVRVGVPIGRDAVGLVLAELHQEAGDSAAAIDTIERLEPTAHAALSLAELYLEVDRAKDVIELTDGLQNKDDLTALLLAYRGVAFGREGLPTAAREAFTAALKSRARAPQVRHYALLGRARMNLLDGKRAQAKKDAERILAENSTYPGAMELLAEMQ